MSGGTPSSRAIVLAGSSPTRERILLCCERCAVTSGLPHSSLLLHNLGKVFHDLNGNNPVQRSERFHSPLYVRLGVGLRRRAGMRCRSRSRHETCLSVH